MAHRGHRGALDRAPPANPNPNLTLIVTLTLAPNPNPNPHPNPNPNPNQVPSTELLLRPLPADLLRGAGLHANGSAP